MTALDLKLFSNGGVSLDLSIGVRSSMKAFLGLCLCLLLLQVLDRAMTHSDNAYKIPNVRIVGKICKTNLASNTAFRGFGGPQAMFITEQWIAHVASFLKVPIEHVREVNMYKDGDETPFGMVQVDCPIRRCWNTLKEKSCFEQRNIVVANFNKQVL